MNKKFLSINKEKKWMNMYLIQKYVYLKMNWN